MKFTVVVTLLLVAEATTVHGFWFFGRGKKPASTSSEETAVPVASNAEATSDDLDMSLMVDGAYLTAKTNAEGRLTQFLATEEVPETTKTHLEGINESMSSLYVSLSDPEIAWTSEKLSTITTQLLWSSSIGFPLLLTSLDGLGNCDPEAVVAPDPESIPPTDEEMKVVDNFDSEVESRAIPMDNEVIIGRFEAITPLMTGMTALVPRTDMLLKKTAALVVQGRLTEAQREEILDVFFGKLNEGLSIMASNAQTGAMDHSLETEVDSRTSSAKIVVHNAEVALRLCSAEDIVFSVRT